MRTGQYINQLRGNLKYKAFIPNTLPFELKQGEKLHNLLSRANLSLGRLDGVAAILPNVDFFIFMYVRKEATVSSQIEGTQATFIDVLKREAKVESSEIHKDVDEVINYIDAMNYGLERLKEFPLSLRLLREIHGKLLREVRGEGKHPGEFRTSQNWIGGPTIETAVFVPPPASEVMNLMGNLEEYLHRGGSTPVLLKTALMHAQFETIHPFLDGNGRIGRLLVTFFLCHEGVLHKPLLYLSDFFKRNRQVYYDRLNALREKDSIEEWIEFFLQGVIETSEAAVEIAKKIITLRDYGFDQIAKLGRSAEKGARLYNYLFRTPMVRVKDVERILGIKNPNALALVSKLVDVGILQELTGRKRNRVFSFADYIGLFE